MMRIPLRENEAVVENQFGSDEKEFQCFVVQADLRTGRLGPGRVLELFKETSHLLKETLTDGVDVLTADL